MRLDILALERLHDTAPAKAGAYYHSHFLTWLRRAVKHGDISEDRNGFYLTAAQAALWMS